MEGLKIDLEQDEVFVFTPKGDVITLPAGATPVDFAYAIHTEVGHRMHRRQGERPAGAARLRAADRRHVEIFTSKAQGEGPSQDWLQFVKTPRARDKIRQWFTPRAPRGRHRARPRRSSKADAQAGPAVQAARDRGRARRRSPTRLKYPTSRRCYVAVGEGHVSPQSVVARLARSRAGHAPRRT